MEEEGGEDNGLEEDSRDGQVCWAWGRHTFPHPMVLVTDILTPLTGGRGCDSAELTGQGHHGHRCARWDGG